MKKLNKIQINSENIMSNDDLLTLKGGYDGNDCAYRVCSSDSDCCPGNPECYEAPNWPGSGKVCWSR